MKRILLTGVVALVGVMILTDTAEARRFRRSRGGNCNNCQTSGCNTGGCAPQAMQQQQYGPQGSPGYAPPPAPGAQTYYGPGNQQANTFYRGQPQQPQMAPNAQGGTNFQGRANANLNAPQGNANLQSGANANLGTQQGNANIQGGANANLGTQQGGANVRAGANANSNSGNAAGRANAGANTNTQLNP